MWKISYAHCLYDIGFHWGQATRSGQNYEIQKAMKIVSVECKKGQVIDVPVMEGAGIP